MTEQFKRDLTVKESTDLVLFSIKYSQGNYLLEEYLLKIVHALHPELRVPFILNEKEQQPDPKFRNLVLAHTTSTARKVVHAAAGDDVPVDQNARRIHTYYNENNISKEIPYSDVHRNLTNTFDNIFKFFTSEVTISDQNLNRIIRNTSSLIIERDYHYLVTKGGRARTHPDRRIPNYDPWLSHFCYYGLLENPTETSFLTEVFREIKKEIGDILIQTNSKDFKRFIRVVKVYNEHHKPHYVCF